MMKPIMAIMGVLMLISLVFAWQGVDLHAKASTDGERLVGVGKILSGIYVLLFAVLVALMVSPLRLGMHLKKGRRK